MVVKGHPSHPHTSELTAKAFTEAAAKVGAPADTLLLLQSRAPEVSNALVTSPGIRAIAFTGSETVGRLLLDVAASRPDPIPFYGELGSLNPVFVGAAAAAARRRDREGPDRVDDDGIGAVLHQARRGVRADRARWRHGGGRDGSGPHGTRTERAPESGPEDVARREGGRKPRGGRHAKRWPPRMSLPKVTSPHPGSSRWMPRRSSHRPRCDTSTLVQFRLSSDATRRR